MRFFTRLCFAAAVLGAATLITVGRGYAAPTTPEANARDAKNPAVKVEATWANKAGNLTEMCDGGEPTAFWDGWLHGGEYDRAPAINAIRSMRTTKNFEDVRFGADCLRRYYGMRAGRKQVALDFESNAVFVGGLGALLSGGAGATTQKYWSYGAVIPVVVAQFSASQPVRDLYAGGRIGLDVISLRYRELDRLTHQLESAMDLPNQDLWPAPGFVTACLKLVDNSIGEWAVAGTAPEILKAYQTIKPLCASAASGGTFKLPNVSLTVACLYMSEAKVTWPSTDTAKTIDYGNLKQACAAGTADQGGQRPAASFAAACVALRDNNIEGWTAGEDRSALLTDYRKLQQACLSALSAERDLFSGLRAVRAWRRDYSYDYAQDLLRLDDEILNKDRQLRYSPVQTLSAMAAAPFTAAATLLSGENGGQAIDRLKTQQAFSTVNVPLSPVILPPCPAPITEVYALGDASLIRRKVARNADAKPSSADVQAALDRMQAVADSLNDARGGMNQQIRLASRIAALAAYDRLDFSYDATTARVSVVLGSSQASPTIPASPATSR